LQEGRPAAGDGCCKTIFAQRVTDRRERRVGHRLHLGVARALVLLGGVGRDRAAGVAGCSIDRSIGMQNQPTGGLRLLDRAPRQPDMGGVAALAHALHRISETAMNRRSA
jgi:hypothetical protein